MIKKKLPGIVLESLRQIDDFVKTCFKEEVQEPRIKKVEGNHFNLNFPANFSTGFKFLTVIALGSLQ